MRPPLFRLMVVGMPNVGKSTFINRLVRKHKLQTAPAPGVTRSIIWLKVKERYLLADSPGIMLPRLPDERTALMLGWIGTIRDHLIGEVRLAASLLARFAQRGLMERIERAYEVSALEHDGPEPLLAGIARRRGLLLAGAAPDAERAARLVLGDFRAGHLGPLTLEWPPDSAAGPAGAKPADPAGMAQEHGTAQENS